MKICCDDQSPAQPVICYEYDDALTASAKPCGCHGHQKTVYDVIDRMAIDRNYTVDEIKMACEMLAKMEPAKTP